MGKTPILQLETSNSTTDASQKFLTYRMNQNGDINSNMTKIDGWADTVNKKVKELQDRVSTVLLNANWISLGYYEATTLDITELKANMLFTIRLNKDNDGTTTIKVNGLTTKSLLKYDSGGSLVNLVSGDLRKNHEYFFRYDGTSWVWQSSTSGDQINIVGSGDHLLSINEKGFIEDSGVEKGKVSNIELSAIEPALPTANTYWYKDLGSGDNLDGFGGGGMLIGNASLEDDKDVWFDLNV